MENNLIANRYMILKHIGKGGMADVYCAYDTILKREVAIKVLKEELSNDPVSLERFRREANASTCLSHSNIVDIYDVGDDGDKHFIVMEYIKGQTLKDLIKKRGALYYPEAVFIMKQLCAAIMEAHRNGIIHRDIKSQNILIKDDGTAKVVDFGIALAHNAQDITSEDAVVGSVHYMAPEHAKGEVANMQSDIYSLGIVFYELLVGDVPFKGDSAVNVVLKACRSALPDVRLFDKRIPQSIVNILLKATAKNRFNRYSNVAEMLKDLNVCLNDEHAHDEPIVFSYSEDVYRKKDPKEDKKKESKKPLLIGSFIVVGIVLVASLVVLLTLSGIFSGPTYVTVPDVKNKSILEASDILSESDLILDRASIKREMTDDIEAGLIIRLDPEIGTSVEKGTRVTAIVSSGIYATMEDVTGQNVEEAKAALESKYPNLTILLEATSSSSKAGTILEQKGLTAGEKFNPNSNITMTLVYSEYVSIILPTSLLDASLEDAKKTLDDLGIAYECLEIDLSSYNLSESYIASLSREIVYDTNPKTGTSIEKNSGTKVTLYYISQAQIEASKSSFETPLSDLEIEDQDNEVLNH